MTQSTRKPRRRKSDKDFPLWQRKDGRWCRKIKQRVFYFGTDRETALEKWLDQKDDLLASRIPRERSEELTVQQLAEAYVTSKKLLVDAGQLAGSTFKKQVAACKQIKRYFGGGRLVVDLGPSDFEGFRAEVQKGLAPNTLAITLVNIRSVFHYACDQDLIDKPVKFGQNFRGPSQKLLRQTRQAAGSKMLEAAEICVLLAAADLTMRAFILVGINCGYGPGDVGALPMDAIDLDKGWIHFARVKTAVSRSCPLWAETVEAIRAAREVRPEARDRVNNGLAFLSPQGNPITNGDANNWITASFRKLLKRAGLHRKGLGFYALRHSFETFAGNSRDQVAINHVMGHTDTSMSAVYREKIDDSRLEAVAAVVHDRLFGDPK